MKIEEIRPYSKNARNNEKAIAVVAESIKEFGLKGQIVLESRDNPVIVAGHTRWAACKSLGWTDIPDERIDYCDDLSEEQIKAYRLADNRTGEIATWNRALLKNEMRELKTLDMSKFKFDFKSKARPYGAERLRTDDAYNLRLINRFDCEDRGFPLLMAEDVAPYELQGFNYAKATFDADKTNIGCHFFIDDYQFERIWNAPDKYVEVLKPYKCVIAPDFSLYMDMPEPMQRWNHYRTQAIAKYWQKQGITVVPLLSWAQPATYSFAFRGIPKGGTVATSSVGVKNSDLGIQTWREGMEIALKIVKPNRVLLYGGNVGFNFGKTELIEYKAGGFHGR